MPLNIRIPGIAGMHRRAAHRIIVCLTARQFSMRLSTVGKWAQWAQWANIGVDVEIVISEYIEITFE